MQLLSVYQRAESCICCQEIDVVGMKNTETVTSREWEE